MHRVVERVGVAVEGELAWLGVGMAVGEGERSGYGQGRDLLKRELALMLYGALAEREAVTANGNSLPQRKNRLVASPDILWSSSP